MPSGGVHPITLDALCRELDCQPGDLIVQTPGPQSEEP
ncbi:helix-turn-helix domain-containing protein [Brevundimonas mediterranea]